MDKNSLDALLIVWLFAAVNSFMAMRCVHRVYVGKMRQHHLAHFSADLYRALALGELGTFGAILVAVLVPNYGNGLSPTVALLTASFQVGTFFFLLFRTQSSDL